MRGEQFIVITTIFPPTTAVKKFSEQDKFQLIVVGDKKTPHDWKYSNAIYIPVGEQEALNYKIVKRLPYNHYARKMVGYIYAIKSKASIIVDADDDNIAKDEWGFPSKRGMFLTTQEHLGFVNTYRVFSEQHIWPRGYPLNYILDKTANILRHELPSKEVRVGVWQGLADGDPDVDAIYRLTNNETCYFDEREPIVLNKGTVCPFNSQNTAFCYAELFPLLYLPAFVTFRFTDILRGLIAQPIMWTKGYLLGFTTATVVQERNPHDYLKDFSDEIPCYLHSNEVINIVSGAIRSDHSITENLYQAYEALERKRIVVPQELDLLTAWFKDISKTP